MVNCPQYNFMLLMHCLWHVKGVAVKYFSAIHAPAKRIFWVHRVGQCMVWTDDSTIPVVIFLMLAIYLD